MKSDLLSVVKNLPLDLYRKVQFHLQRIKDRKDFRSSVLVLARNGFFTKSDMTKIESRCKELEMSLNDLKDIRATVFETALWAVKENGTVGEKQEKDMKDIQSFLMIPQSEIEPSIEELSRLRVLTEIKKGNMPTVLIPNIVLHKNEVVHWRESANILEERVVDRHYEGRSQGVSVRIAKGVTYRVGSQRGHLVTSKALVPITSGDFVVTTKRVIFMGGLKSFEIKLDKILSVNFGDDGVIFTSGRAKPFIVQFARPAYTEVVQAVFSYSMNNFSERE